MKSQWNENQLICHTWNGQVAYIYIYIYIYIHTYTHTRTHTHTGLKIVGTGACLPWCSISSSFQNSLKTSGHWVYEFLEFWCWNLVPFLPDIGFQLLKTSWSSLMYFSFNDVPNVLYSWKIWTAGRPFQHPDSSTTKPCCCNSCSMCFALSCWKDVIWRGAYVALKPLYTFQHS